MTWFFCIVPAVPLCLLLGQEWRANRRQAARQRHPSVRYATGGIIRRPALMEREGCEVVIRVQSDVDSRALADRVKRELLRLQRNNRGSP